ncbi:MAG: hypothetical protein J0H18_15800 [Rhizobiales bacterium]|nr:hypothetical protein [Hyphomicrobiales bacterium]
MVMAIRVQPGEAKAAQRRNPASVLNRAISRRLRSSRAAVGAARTVRRDFSRGEQSCTGWVVVQAVRKSAAASRMEK